MRRFWEKEVTKEIPLDFKDYYVSAVEKGTRFQWWESETNHHIAGEKGEVVAKVTKRTKGGDFYSTLYTLWVWEDGVVKIPGNWYLVKFKGNLEFVATGKIRLIDPPKKKRK